MKTIKIDEPVWANLMEKKYKNKRGRKFRTASEVIAAGLESI